MDKAYCSVLVACYSVVVVSCSAIAGSATAISYHAAADSVAVTSCVAVIGSAVVEYLLH